MDLISVIIPTKDRAHLLEDAVKSVFAVARDSFELEVIVVDDGSKEEHVHA